MFVHELLLIHSIIAQITQLTLIWVGGISSFPCWFSLNNSKMMKAVTLAFCNSAQILGKTNMGVFPISEFLVNPL